MKQIIIAAVSLVALATVLAVQPAKLDRQAGIACPGCTNTVSTTLACGGCTNGVSLNVACPGCTNLVSTTLSCGGCTNGVTLALAGF